MSVSTGIYDCPHAHATHGIVLAVHAVSADNGLLTSKYVPPEPYQGSFHGLQVPS